MTGFIEHETNNPTEDGNEEKFDVNAWYDWWTAKKIKHH